jgi:hypothetical protein
MSGSNLNSRTGLDWIRSQPGSRILGKIDIDQVETSSRDTKKIPGGAQPPKSGAVISAIESAT